MKQFFKKHKRKLRWILPLLAVVFTLYFLYARFLAPTAIAFVHFPEFRLSAISKANDNPFIRTTILSEDDLDKAGRYSAVFIFGRGFHLDESQQQHLLRASKKGVPIFVEGATNPAMDFTNLTGDRLEAVKGYLNYGGLQNNKSLLNYARKVFDGKSLFTDAILPPEEIDRDVLFHIDEALTFKSLEAFEEYGKQQGFIKERAPIVALLTSVPGPFNANRDHLNSLITAMHHKGLNVYPIAAYASRAKWLKQLKPDLVVAMPHGRFSLGGADSTVAWLQENNTPVLTPLSVFEPYDKWHEDPRGMTGGILNMSVTLPEIDGAVAPYAVIAQYRDENGYLAFKAIPDRLEKFADMVEKQIALKQKPNRDKKIAIYYFKGPGKNAMVAANLEVVNSLYNVLTRLKAEGYRVEELPTSAKGLETLIQQNGSVLGPYAEGSMQAFFEKGKPALVPAAEYEKWAKKDLSPQRWQSVIDRYGPAPGEYMAMRKGDTDYVAVARIQLGNVVLLPQPMAGIGDDTFKMVHGTDEAPPHTYIASYLWSRHAFNADAVMHFGTHGSLEFTPGKEIALSSNDWPDMLIGNTPHFYVYTISNVGEGMIAKRRTYATLFSYLTPPFMKGETYNELAALEQTLHKFTALEDPAVQHAYAKSISDRARKMGLYNDMQIADSTRDLSVQEVNRLAELVEEIGSEKVTSGLYTLGVPYTAEQLDATVRLMAIDPIAYGLAKLGVLKGAIPAERLEQKTFVNTNYTKRAEGIIKDWQQGRKIALSNLVSSADMVRAAAWKERQAAQTTQRRQRRGQGGPPPEVAAALANAQKPAKPHDQKEADFADAVNRIETAVNYLDRYREALSSSTEKELQAIVNGLGGGYTPPSSGGDPIVNPQSVPSGRNLYSIDAEKTPSAEAWEVGKMQVRSMLEKHQEANHGEYPKKVAFTLWAGDFIHTEGAMLAQIFYLLGIEPVRDAFGRVADVRLMSVSELGRPRVDVVVQTSGQLRDLAASRLELINKAVAMAAAADDEDNPVKAGANLTEKLLKEKGFSPREARELATLRVFGGVNGSYGTGITGMVEKGDSWEDRSEIAQTYLNNMGALYNDDKHWADFKEGVFEAALQNTDVVIHPRSSNTWGALSLDHVYEFAGGLNIAVQEVTGNDPAVYFSDSRNPSNPRVQELKEAIWVEARSTLLNPKYVGELLQGSASSAEVFAETFRNTYSWNVMKPDAIDAELWNQLHETYVQDKLQLGVKTFFDRENPYALQELTAVMLETVRKGLWQPTGQQLKEITDLHVAEMKDHGAGCSGFVCGNAALNRFIADKLQGSDRTDYETSLKEAKEIPSSSGSDNADNQATVLKKVDEQTADKRSQGDKQSNIASGTKWVLVAVVLLTLLVLLIGYIRKKNNAER
ncbi:cobaltochelatase subunit CobN [Sphingobacterium chuzhouense]|uniref:Cobaltochelatase subunit CobN n=1 Tax=Sphingobacterium chuzhouense TaxID=1742264 RepID=A0ABR7XQE4_9SPHI|nr:cobaltochelatase subunit CobN [Sphingobacterium chuzhouense]MBD1421392.1 cobaltochelatase subunit CobN [Sphingobacterium chuzhouense]